MIAVPWKTGHEASISRVAATRQGIPEGIDQVSY